MSDVTLVAEKRDGSASHVRESGNVPVVMYGHGMETTSLQINGQELARVIRESGESSIVEVSVDGETKNVLIKEVQKNALTGDLIHVDFYAVSMSEKIAAEVSLEFEGTSAAVKDESGILVKNFDAIEVEALPTDLPEKIVVDISSLATFDDQITVADLKLPSGVIATLDPEQVVATVSEPRSEEELESLDEAVEEDVSAVEGVEKEEPAEEGEGEEGAGDDSNNEKDNQ